MKFSTIQNSFFFFLIGSITVLFFWMINDFLFTIFWAIVLGIVFYPAYKWILKITKNKKNLSSFFTILSILILIFIPIYFISKTAATESSLIYKNLTTDNTVNKYLNSIKSQQNIQSLSSTFNINLENLNNEVISSTKNILTAIRNQAVNFGKYTVNTIISFFIMIYILFFIFKDGVKILNKISDILPLGNKKEQRVFDKFISIVRAIFKGTIIVAIIQGILGGILLYIVGIKTFILLTMIMIILSIIPAVGPALVLFPAGLLFIFNNQMWQGLLLLIGMILISIIDNILRPILVGNATKMHDTLITISMFGGLTTFGATGFIIGPVIAGVFVTVWTMFEEKYKIELKEKG